MLSFSLKTTVFLKLLYVVGHFCQPDSRYSCDSEIVDGNAII